MTIWQLRLLAVYKLGNLIIVSIFAYKLHKAFWLSGHAMDWMVLAKFLGIVMLWWIVITAANCVVGLIEVKEKRKARI